MLYEYQEGTGKQRRQPFLPGDPFRDLLRYLPFSGQFLFIRRKNKNQAHPLNHTVPPEGDTLCSPKERYFLKKLVKIYQFYQTLA